MSQRHRNHPWEAVRPQVVTNLRHASVSLRVPGCGKVPSLRDDVCGDGSRCFYNRTSAAPRCGACRAGVHSPGRGPGLTESASALRTSDAGLLPESLCRKRCGHRMQGCCRSSCAGSVADVGCRVVADAVVEVNGKPHKVVVK